MQRTGSLRDTCVKAWRSTEVSDDAAVRVRSKLASNKVTGKLLPAGSESLLLSALSRVIVYSAQHQAERHCKEIRTHLLRPC
jgi:hypothetical protein